MLSLIEKISFLESYLDEIQDNYADSFKTDISMCLVEFDLQNSNLLFLNNLSSLGEIEDWVNKLTAKIVLKFDEESEDLNDFIFDYLRHG